MVDEKKDKEVVVSERFKVVSVATQTSPAISDGDEVLSLEEAVAKILNVLDKLERGLL